MTSASRWPGREAPGRVRRLPKHRRADDEDGVVGRELLAEPGPVGGQEAREERVVLREPRTRAERLLEHRRDEPLRERDERLPRPPVVGARADDDRR